MPKGNSDSRAYNKFSVPQKTWGTWTLVARHVFNKTFETMTLSPDSFRHTEDQTTEVDKARWKVTAWNSAWLAASLCSRGEKYLYKKLELRAKI